ncbi:putative LRR receptor-like serine/threonine-protein kinase [Senna tora]|uniref:non-specific serine/threonine protein kinase n=1 Tax=Senna tora TaxID=362788 RepID=A0A834T407_9FABA|nr:putative LRR receptor-like serine/threonine-protein kinase [Senna tora]
MGENQFSGEIPISLGNLSQLVELSIPKNNLEGKISPIFGNWKYLLFLDLSENKFTGDIPFQDLSVSPLSKLLNLSHNSFNGSLPFEVGALKNFWDYGYSENYLSGEIPETIGECINQPRTFSLDQRLNILYDVSSALHYLHYECEQPIVHCDLKPSNILLDDDMVAHVSGFGLARLLSTFNGVSQKQSSTTRIKGTISYAMLLQYGIGFEVSTQGDVYSFGILVLEMVTGRRPTEDMFIDDHDLHSYVITAYPNNVLEIVDLTLLRIKYNQQQQKKSAFRS